MKKVLIATGIAALALITVAGAQGYVFSSNLTVGSTGAAVAALQTWLNTNGFTIPAIATGAAAPGYFGSQTKTAVMQYQASKGIPNTGFVGPLTRAALNAGGTATVPSSPATCPAGYTCVPTNGVPVTPSTGSGEGTFTVKQAAQPANNTNVTSNMNVPVFGVEIKAQNSDMTIDRADLKVGVTVSGTTVNPAGFISSISAWDGTTLLKTMSLSATDFTKDNSGVYYVRLTGIGFKVSKDQTKTLTFTVNTASVNSVDTARLLTVTGYGTQSLRGVDGLGLSSYGDLTSWTSSFTFNASNNSTLTATADSNTPDAQSIAVNTTDGVRGVVMQTFNLKSTTGASQVDRLRVYVKTDSVTTSAPTALYLYDGSTLVSSGSVTVTSGSGYVDFSNLTIPVLKDQTKTLTVKADFPATAAGVASTTIDDSATQSDTSLFDTADATTKEITVASDITGNDVHLYADSAPQWTLVSASIAPTAGVVNVASSSVTGTIVLRVKANGGTLTKPVAGDFTVVFASSTQGSSNATTYTSANSITPNSTSVSVSPSTATVGDGNYYDVTVTGTLFSSNSSFMPAVGSGYSEFMAIKEIDSVITKTSGQNTIANQNWGIDRFFTPSALLTRGTQ